MNTKYKTIEDMIIKPQSLKSKTKMKFNLAFSYYCDGTNSLRQRGKFHFQEDPFSKNAESIALIMLKDLLRLNYKLF